MTDLHGTVTPAPLMAAGTSPTFDMGLTPIGFKQYPS